ncbi:MAG TPA: hypothetical protein VK135_06865, partial [Candidatus Dormibacteraeota bacterium]|nr:hypothetical protein [Candidatus Dormibacteraeota bacterium]
MKKWFALMALLSIFLVSACSIDSDELSGKTFKIAHPPVLEEELDNPSSYYPIVTLKFSKSNSVSNTLDDAEGTYELNEDVLVINFENKNEKLKVHFIDFKESDKDFSSYSAVIGHSDLHIEDS